MRLILALAVAMLLSITMAWSAPPALAGPAAPVTVALQQPDGSSFDAQPFGDEWHNGYETPEGYTLVRDRTTGFWQYATTGPAGGLMPSGTPAGRQPPPGLDRHLRDSTRPRGPSSSPALRPRPAPAEAAAATRSQKVLTILAQFTDRPAVGSTPADWQNALFGAGSSVRSYYREASYGKFDFLPAEESHGMANDGIVGWLTLPYPHPNPAANVTDINRQIVRDAILAADPYVNFASFNANYDGEISKDELHLVIVVAGYETAYGGASSACSPSVWAHQWALGGTVAGPFVDGVMVAHYASDGGYTQLGEWHCRASENPGHMATFGTIAHELGHDINWPDLYDTSGTSEGVGQWSLMGSGNWLAAGGGYLGSSPSHPDAFLKSYQGWLTPYRVAGSQPSVPLEQAETTPRAVQVLYNPNGVDWSFEQHSGSGEYFLVENRQQTGYDAGLPGCGLLVWHIDEGRPYDNSANADYAHPLVDLEEADGLYHLHSKANRGDPGDPYPGTRGVHSFDQFSNPNSFRYSGLSSGVQVQVQNSSCASTMVADFSDSAALATPTATPTPSTKPNLAPFVPTGWQYPLVPSSVPMAHTVNTLYAAEVTYFNWAVNNPSSTNSNAQFNVCLYLDGTEIQRWPVEGLAAGYYAYVENWPYFVGRSGQHTVKVTADCGGIVAEADESDNSWQMDFYWLGEGPTPTPTSASGPFPDLAPYVPPGWQYPIVPSYLPYIHNVVNLYAEWPTYIDYAYANWGNAVATGPFYTCLYLDGVEIRRSTVTNLYPNWYGYTEDFEFTVPTRDR